MIPLRSKRVLSIFIPLVYVAMVLFLAFSVIQAVNVRHTTGVLEVKTSDKTSAISISTTNTQAALIGTGNTRVRLKPGSYFIMAQANGLQASQTVIISLHQTTKISLRLANATPVVPSPATIQFLGTDNLINYGLSATQVTYLKQLFFTYAPSAKIIAINAATIQSGAHDPNSTSPWFSLTFNGTIDTANFKATLEYSGLDTIKLTLNDAGSGAQLFSGQLPAVPTVD